MTIFRGCTASAGVLTLALLAACGGPKSEPPAASVASEPGAPSGAPALKAGPGVDVANRTVTLGALNDESGPAAAIGKPYALGKRILAAQINEGGTGLLPEGWKLKLLEKDHGYNPQRAVQAYNQLRDQVLFIATSFGTPNTLPLRPMLERDQMLALPASLASKMAEHRYTVPGGATNEVEAMRGVDFVVEQVQKAGGTKADIKIGIVYQQDDFGEDGKQGLAKAAAHHQLQVVSEQTVTPGQRDFTAVVTALKDAGVTHVVLTVLPSATGPILGTAAQLQFSPMWVGMTAAWIDGFFKPEVIPSSVFANFYSAGSLPYWGEPLPGMDAFLAAYQKHGASQGPPDFYVLASYAQGLAAVEYVKRAIEAGDVTRAGVMAQVAKLSHFDAGGLIRSIDTTRFPYVTTTEARVMTPDFAKKSWTVVSDYATPRALVAGAE